MTEFLIQDKTGRVYVRTETLAGRKDMKPYEWPAPKDELVDMVFPDSSFTPSMASTTTTTTTAIDDMTKEQLCAYAAESLGIELNKRKTREVMIEQVREFIVLQGGTLDSTKEI